MMKQKSFFDSTEDLLMFGIFELDLGVKVVPNRKKFKEPALTLRKNNIGMEFAWSPDDPGIVGWLELKWGPRSKNPRTGSSGNDDLKDVLQITREFFK